MSNPQKAAEIVPFGKYKGQPVEVLAQDRGYCDWLAGQEWFRTRFATIHTLIVNNFAEPSETPEHNALQAQFLDAAWRQKFVIARYGRQALRDILVENFGHDVGRHKALCEWLSQEMEKAKGRHEQYLAEATSAYQKCLDNLTRLQRLRPSNDGVIATTVATSDPRFEVGGVDVCFQATVCQTDTSQLQFHEIRLRSPFNGERFGTPEDVDETRTHYIECKPFLGDDYPAVLRQIRASALAPIRQGQNTVTRNLLVEGNYRFSLVIGDYTGTGATLEQVRQIFKPIGILTIADIEGEAA